MTAILTQEQVEQLTYTECQSALKRLAREHRLTTPWQELTQEEKQNTDLVGNTLLWLEDRIRLFEDVRVSSMNPNGVIAQPIKKEVDPSQAKRPARQFKINDKIYQDVHEASLKTGIKVGTLRTYITRKPEIYSYVD